jgi:secretion/DNA translocation related TadE-like protein
LLGLAGLVVLAGVAGAGRGAATVARHRVEAAADLAALAAATRLVGSPQLAGSPPLVGSSATPCATAVQVAHANGATLLRCRLTGPDVEVEAETTLAFGGLGSYRAHARARAGPVESQPVPPAGR